LDVGCGLVSFCRNLATYLRKYVKDVFLVGIDINPSVLREREKYDEFVRDKSFDCSMCIDVIDLASLKRREECDKRERVTKESVLYHFFSEF